MNFLDRTEMSDIFYKYIPKFEYELVSLREYSFNDLAKFGDILSMFMIIDKLKTAEAFTKLGELPKDYIKQLDSMNLPTHLKDLLVNVCIMLLRKINVPQDEIDVLLEKIDERGISQMLTIENYDVQKTRQEARAEAEHWARAEQERANRVYQQLKSAVKLLLDQGNTISEIATQMNMSEQDMADLLPELT